MCYAIARRDVYKEYLHRRRQSQAVSIPKEMHCRETEQGYPLDDHVAYHICPPFAKTNLKATHTSLKS